jgi:hypothetical protein
MGQRASAPKRAQKKNPLLEVRILYHKERWIVKKIFFDVPKKGKAVAGTQNEKAFKFSGLNPL